MSNGDIIWCDRN